MKVCQLGAELFHVDMPKLTVAFHNFADVPQNKLQSTDSHQI